MVRTILAAVLVNRAADRLEQDDPERALRTTGRALKLIGGSTAPLACAHAGRAHQVQAESYLRLDQLDSAIASYSLAERCLKGRYVELYVRCCHDAAITFGNMGLDEIARSYAQKGYQAAATLPGSYRRDFGRLLLELEECDTENYPRYARRMRDAAAEAADPEDARRALYCLALATCEYGDDAEVTAIFDVIEALYRNAPNGAQRLSALSPLVFLARNPRPIPDVLQRAGEQIHLDLPDDVETAQLAEAHLVRAVLLQSSGRLAEAMKAALQSVAFSNFISSQTGASAARLLTGGRRITALDVALRLACEMGDGPLAAELIETARLPALPDKSAPAQKIVLATADGPVEVARRRLGPLHPVGAGGPSRLAAYYPSAASIAAPIDLDKLIEKIGGKAAWWWGAWLGAYGVAFWAVRSPEGEYCCGWHQDSHAAVMLTEAQQAMPDAGDASTHGVFTASYASEEAFSAKLGELLIPQQLSNAVLAAALDGGDDRDTAISLVVASNYLSTVPFTLMGVGADSMGRPVRLIEGAVVRLAPPAALLSHIDTTRARASNYSISVTCSDPSGKLTYAHFSSKAARSLGSAAFCAAHPDAELATAGNLLGALRDARAPGAIFAYCGHAGIGNYGPDLESFIPLVDGVLTAESILAGNADGDAITMPERVLLAACNSAGSGGVGSGEWLGLTAATLSAGACEVLATAWTIWDLPITCELDADLLNLLAQRQDVAGGLRDVQLRCLERWRGCSAEHVDGIRHDAPEAFPLVWAAYHYLGLPPSAGAGGVPAKFSAS